MVIESNCMLKRFLKLNEKKNKKKFTVVNCLELKFEIKRK
jgi:hypothetical protein